MKTKECDDFKQMDPDFGRYKQVGYGFGEISDEEYSKLVKALSESSAKLNHEE